MSEPRHGAALAFCLSRSPSSICSRATESIEPTKKQTRVKHTSRLSCANALAPSVPAVANSEALMYQSDMVVADAPRETSAPAEAILERPS